MSLAASLNVGVSALRAYSEGIQTVSNNIANVNTVGYKASHAQYADTFSNILRPMVPNEKGDAAKIAPTQVGGGVQVESVAPVFSQGTIQVTNSSSDLAIAGNGFFMVRNPTTNQMFVTRAGNFRVDADGALVTQQGYHVQGSRNAFTTCIYDTVTGAYNVQGPQDNYQVIIPSGQTTKQVTGWTASAAGSTVMTGGNIADVSVGMPISGTGISTGTKITGIDAAAGTITLSQPVLQQISAGSLTVSLNSVSAQSTMLTFPADYRRPDLAKGMPLIGPGIDPGTTIELSSGTFKTIINASANSVALSVTASATQPQGGNSLDVASIAGLAPGMVISAPGTALDGKLIGSVTAATDSASASITVVNGTNAPISVNGISALQLAASGAKTLTRTSNVLRLPAAQTALIKLGDAVSGEGIPPGTFVKSKGTASPIDGKIDIALGDVGGPQATADQIAAGNDVFPITDSYAAVRLAFGDEIVTLNKPPTVDSFDAVTFSLGSAYRPAPQVGDVRISFNESDGKVTDPLNPPDYTFVGTDGKPLNGIQLAAARAAAPRIRTFNVGTSGQINVILSNGQTFTSGSVLLQMFKDPGALTREGDNLFSGMLTAGPYNGRFEDSNITRLTPSNGGLGVINGGSLELSNVDLGEEFSTMITTQRAFQAGSRVITTTDQMMEEAVNLKR